MINPRFAEMDLGKFFMGGANETKMGINALMGRSQARRAAEEGEFLAGRGGITGLQSAKMGEMLAEQILAGAPAQGSGAMSGLLDAGKSILSGLSSSGMFGGAETPGGELYGFDPIGSKAILSAELWEECVKADIDKL